MERRARENIINKIRARPITENKNTTGTRHSLQLELRNFKLDNTQDKVLPNLDEAIYNPA